MIDGFGRTIDYLRISVTDRCNLRCVYCMKEEQQEFLPSGELLTLEEWVRLCKGAALAGIRKIRITGGEPLMRQDIVELVEAISNIPGIEKVVMTSNAVHLAPLAEKLKKAGLSGVNVSIDSLDAKQYCRLTRRDVLSDALAGLASCGKVGLPVKVNCVPVAGENEKELLHLAELAKAPPWDMPSPVLLHLAELAKAYPMEVRFIEMMPIGEGSAFPPVKNETIRKRLEEVYGEFIQTEKDDREGPAVYYTNEHFKGRIGFISPVSRSFCHQCNRIRMTAEGKLKLCLHHPVDCDLRELVRSGAEPEEIQKVLQERILQKPRDGHTTDESRPMWKIGG